MATRLLESRLRRGTPQALLLVAVCSLTLFYYGMRADEIGSRRAGSSWSAMTAPPRAPLEHYVGSFALLAVLPVLAAALLGRRPRDLGLGLGRARLGLAWLAAGIPVAVLAAHTGAGSRLMRAVYPLDPTLDAHGFLPAAAVQFLYFGSWEVLFRGVLLFGLRPQLGSGTANAVQTAMSVLAHFGRAPDETFAAIPAGLLFGWVDLKVGSIWYVAVLHWIVGAGVEGFIVGAFGPNGPWK